MVTVACLERGTKGLKPWGSLWAIDAALKRRSSTVAAGGRVRVYQGGKGEPQGLKPRSLLGLSQR